MTIIFRDTFGGEGSNVNLDSHTPDTTGTSWIRRIDTTTSEVQVKSATSTAQASANENNVGQSFAANPAPSSADYDVVFIMSAVATATSNRPVGVVARRTADNDFYSASLSNPSGVGTCYIHKRVGGTYTELGNASVTIAADDEWKFELRGTTLKLYQKASGGSFVERISVTDSAHSSAGEAQVAWGNVTQGGGHIVTGWQMTEFYVDEVSAGSPVVNGASTLVTVSTVNADGQVYYPFIYGASTIVTVSTVNADGQVYYPFIYGTSTVVTVSTVNAEGTVTPPPGPGTGQIVDFVTVIYSQVEPRRATHETETRVAMAGYEPRVAYYVPE